MSDKYSNQSHNGSENQSYQQHMNGNMAVLQNDQMYGMGPQGVPYNSYQPPLLPDPQIQAQAFNNSYGSYGHTPMNRMAWPPLTLVHVGNGQYAPVMMNNPHAHQWTYPSQQWAGGLGYNPQMHHQQPLMPQMPQIPYHTNVTSPQISIIETERKALLDDEQFPPLEPNNRLQESPSNLTFSQPMPAASSTRIANESMSERNSIVMKHKDSSIRINRDMKTGLVTVEDTPKWINEAPSKIDNNENSNEYTTDDEVEIQDVTNRISNLCSQDASKRGISMLDDTDFYRPQFVKQSEDKSASIKPQRINQLKTTKDGSPAYSEPSTHDKMRVPVNTPCEDQRSPNSSSNHEYSLNKGGLDPVDIIEATKRAGKALQPVQDNKFRKNFRSNDRTITNEPRIGSPDQENFIGGKINIRVNEFDRNFSQKPNERWNNGPAVYNQGFRGRGRGRGMPNNRGRGRGRGGRGRGQNNRGYHHNNRGYHQNQNNYGNRDNYRPRGYPKEELGSPIRRTKPTPRES